MRDGHTGAALDWNEVLARLAAADVVLIGETHDDPHAHAFEQAVAQDLCALWPRCAVSLEMLERNEQPTVDAWLRGEIDTEEMIDQTGSANWAGEGSWVPWYQPILDAARDNGGRVVAANAPRPYVRCAREQGLEALEQLPPDEALLFDLPTAALASAAYRERFRQIMHSMARAAGNEPASENDIDQMLRSQATWDATMAASIARARAMGASVVIHSVGSFHVSHEGGTVLELRQRRPSDRIVVVVVERAGAATAAGDVPLADIVVGSPLAE